MQIKAIYCRAPCPLHLQPSVRCSSEQPHSVSSVVAPLRGTCPRPNSACPLFSALASFFGGGGGCSLEIKLIGLEMTATFDDCDILAFSCYQYLFIVVKPEDAKWLIERQYFKHNSRHLKN